ncbi:hypothetical protein PR202_gb08522 [Eleusine coracana subsp. coracana]|uniref:Uncharacterized protein n=1 Tax=Eleusine coracana subsp. coracana TaxID=191504 RepID=A0AAV5ECF8_ELECO|nr:hypothetical protein PR202_gb08522 [Eleusine coracana subsp. coracana]
MRAEKGRAGEGGMIPAVEVEATCCGETLGFLRGQPDRGRGRTRAPVARTVVMADAARRWRGARRRHGHRNPCSSAPDGDGAGGGGRGGVG